MHRQTEIEDAKIELTKIEETRKEVSLAEDEEEFKEGSTQEIISFIT